jgi:hypothetical protein
MFNLSLSFIGPLALALCAIFAITFTLRAYAAYRAATKLLILFAVLALASSASARGTRSHGHTSHHAYTHHAHGRIANGSH